MHANSKMLSMWNATKEYFGDGYIDHSRPIRFNTHVCHLKTSLSRNANVYYGVNIPEDTMPFFSALGQSRSPPCSCQEVQTLVQEIDNFIQVAPETHPEDYSLQSGKNDLSIDDACAYALRDALQWWIHWHGSLDSHHWKHLYLAFGTVPDDVMIPPQHLLDGSFRLLGNLLQDVLDGLLSEGVHPDDIKFLELSIWLQYILQYLEKIESGLRDLLLSKTTVMTQFRAITGGAHSAAVLLLAARNTKSLGVEDTAVELAGICIALSLDIAKELMGILQGEKTETVAGDREQLKAELRWVYVRCLEALDDQPNAHLLRRYATSGLHFVPIMDRYRERLTQTRFPISDAQRDVLDSYRKQPDGHVFDGIGAGDHNDSMQLSIL